MATPPNYRGFKVTRGDATGEQLAILTPTSYRVLHFASAADANTDWNVANPTDPTFYIHSETTPATDYLRISHDGTTAELHTEGGTLQLSGTTSVALRADGTTGATVSALGTTVADDLLLSVGTGSTARLSWDTTDANANALLLQLPAGGAVDVPVVAIGQSIESVDLGLYNGIVDPKIALFGVGAVTTGPTLEFRKARGTVAAPTVVTSGDDIGRIMAYGAVAAGEYVQAAAIEFDMAGTIATTRGPGTITFKTATDAAPSVLTTAMTISAAQKVTIASGESTGDFKLNLTLTAGADGVGTNGEQLTSGGAAAETSWTAAASLREFKDILRTVNDKAEEALARVKGANVYDFKYRRDAETSTKDFDTTYRGIVADEYPEVMHYNGRIFNPINAFGELVLAIKALAGRVEAMEAAQ